jgi:hypothetical protein
MKQNVLVARFWLVQAPYPITRLRQVIPLPPSWPHTSVTRAKSCGVRAIMARLA